MASRSTKYTSLLSRCHLPDDSQRAIHNQSTIERFETSPAWVQKIFLTVQEIVDVRGSPRICSTTAYQLFAPKCVKTPIRGKKQRCLEILLRYDFKICIRNSLSVEILRIAKYFSGCARLFLIAIIIHRKLFVVNYFQCNNSLMLKNWFSDSSLTNIIPFFQFSFLQKGIDI